jgi:DNA repair protein RadA/Sms
VGKVKRLFVCADCGQPSAQWAGRCSSCGSWGTVGEHPAGTGSVSGSGRERARVASLTADPEERRIGTGIPGMDRVLGGGLVPGSVVLLAGAPGIGKSTLLLQLASRLSHAGHPCLLASGEEARAQVAARARRLGIPGDALRFVPGRFLAEVLAAAEAERPAVLVLDSIQTIRDEDSDALPGGTGQVRACADAMIGLAKERGVSVVLVGHVTKDGDVAGPRTLEHAVDVVLQFDGEPRSGLRVLSGGKNRFGPEGEVAWFEMTSEGLSEREAGPRLGHEEAEPGCATGLVLAGRRAFAVDVQALVVPTEGPPRRQVAGLDPRRFHIVAAVAERAAGVRLVRSELYGACGGGIRVEDPGADLAVAAALASAASGVPPPAGFGFVGEVSLTGTIRAVSGMEQRAAVAATAGVSVLICPEGAPPGSAGARVRLEPVRHLREALSWTRTGGRWSLAG